MPDNAPALRASLPDLTALPMDGSRRHTDQSWNMRKRHFLS